MSYHALQSSRRCVPLATFRYRSSVESDAFPWEIPSRTTSTPGQGEEQKG
jgi:hypothetical protein